MSGLKNLISNHREDLARVKSYYDSTSKCSCGSGISKLMNALPSIISIATLVMGGVGVVSNVASIGARSSVFTAGKRDSGNAAGSVSYTYTFANDYKTDYAADAKKAIDAELEKVNAKIDKVNKSITDLKIEDLSATYNTALNTTLPAKKSAYDQAKANYEAADTITGDNRNQVEVDRLKGLFEKAEAEYQQAQTDADNAKEALEKAEAKKKEIEEKELKPLTDKKAELETKRSEYETLNLANGTAADRVDSNTANSTDALNNQTYDIKNANQLINEFASAKRAYESDPSSKNKKYLQTAYDNFMLEYGDGKREGITSTITNAQKVMEAYMGKVNKK